MPICVYHIQLKMLHGGILILRGLHITRQPASIYFQVLSLDSGVSRAGKQQQQTKVRLHQSFCGSVLGTKAAVTGGAAP